MPITTPERAGVPGKAARQPGEAIQAPRAPAAQPHGLGPRPGNPSTTGRAAGSTRNPQKYSTRKPLSLPDPSAEDLAQMELEDLEREVGVRNYLDAASTEQEMFIARVADNLGWTYDQADALVRADVDGTILGTVMNAQALQDIYTGAWSDGGADIVDYDDLPDRILARNRTSGKALEMMRRVMMETPSPQMFAPLWPPLAPDGYQDPPVPVLKVDMLKKLNGRDGRRWSVRPMAEIRPEPTIPCTIPGCIKLVDTEANLLEHIEGKHKQRAETHRKEQALQIERSRDERDQRRETRESEDLEMRRKDLELREREIALRENEMRLRMNSLGLVTTQQARDEATDLTMMDKIAEEKSADEQEG